METQLQLQPSYTDEQIAIIAQKGLSWKQFGEMAAGLEIQLLEDAASLIKRIEKLPTTIEEIQVAEATLKNVSSEYLRLEENRKKVTSTTDKITERFMAPSKSVQPLIVAYRNSIVAVKTTYEKSQLAVKEKVKEITFVKEYLSNQVNAFDAACKQKIADKISGSYKWALALVGEKPRIHTVDKLSEHIVTVLSHLTVKDFIFNPNTPKLVYLNEQDYADMVAEVNIPTDYVKLFHDDVKEKYSDYETAQEQAEAALRIDKEESAAKERAIAEELKNKNIAAKLDAVAVPIVDKNVVKPLKKSYALSLPENWETSDEAWTVNARIISACISNWSACIKETRLKNAGNFSVNHMIKCLEGLKNEDNTFEVTGIVWKEVSKL